MSREEGPVTLSGVKRPEPETIGGCRIEARLTTGAGRLYRAVDLAAGRTVVVKLMTPPFDEDPAMVERFLAFGQALVGLKHPHVVPVLRAGTDGHTPYIVFDYVEGEDLDRAIKRERALPPAAAVRAVLDAIDGLGAAYARQVVHGDLRPRHLLRVRGQVRVTGFGLSPVFETAQGRKLAGHPGYIAPEVLLGKAMDHRADMYAVGVSLFELLTGRTPFGTGGPDALIACHLHEPFPSLPAPFVKDLDVFVQRLVMKKPERRFDSWADAHAHGLALMPVLRAVQPTPYRLVIEEGRQAGLSQELGEGDLLLGRTVGDGLALDDGRVSRRHAQVRRVGDFIEVEDLGSRNGIKVNGVEVRARQLQPGDRIEVGDTVLRLEGPTPVAQQLPAIGPGGASPLRGAYGETELAHSPQHQAKAQALSQGDKDAARRLHLLGRLAPLLIQRGAKAAWADALAAVAEATGADDHLVVPLIDGRPAFDAKSSREAQVLSCALPALERALPGQLSLATTVRVGDSDRWRVCLAPVFVDKTVAAYWVLARGKSVFDDDALTLLEATASLLSLRSDDP